MLKLQNIVSNPSIEDWLHNVPKQYKKCNYESHSDGWNIVNFLIKHEKANTIPSPIEFDEFIKDYPEYKIQNRGLHKFNALDYASILGNHELVKHILGKYGENNIDLGNNCEWSSLHCACMCSNTENGYKDRKNY